MQFTPLWISNCTWKFCRALSTTQHDIIVNIKIIKKALLEYWPTQKIETLFWSQEKMRLIILQICSKSYNELKYQK